MIAVCGELGSCFVRLLNQWDIRRYSKGCKPLLTLTGKNDMRDSEGMPFLVSVWLFDFCSFQSKLLRPWELTLLPFLGGDVLSLGYSCSSRSEVIARSSPRTSNRYT